MNYPENVVYTGEWFNNEQHGLGTMIFSDGSIY